VAKAGGISQGGQRRLGGLMKLFAVMVDIGSRIS